MRASTPTTTSQGGSAPATAPATGARVSLSEFMLDSALLSNQSPTDATDTNTPTTRKNKNNKKKRGRNNNNNDDDDDNKRKPVPPPPSGGAGADLPPFDYGSRAGRSRIGGNGLALPRLGRNLPSGTGPSLRPPPTLEPEWRSPADVGGTGNGNGNGAGMGTGMGVTDPRMVKERMSGGGKTGWVP
ncbi:hypothetical protein F5X96DRAFT_695654 [Biscogniauxia mediterranea]|nr:hypothetical protein F5X96DRAFT_695654 [Biscogniauxia mediterranea]